MGRPIQHPKFIYDVRDPETGRSMRVCKARNEVDAVWHLAFRWRLTLEEVARLKVTRWSPETSQQPARDR